jgi:hypothetical protein
MKRASIVLAILLAGGAAMRLQAGEGPGKAPETRKVPPEPPVLKALDEKIAKNLKRGKWSRPSAALVEELWKEYKRAWMANRRPSGGGGSPKMQADVKHYAEYVGSYFKSAEREGAVLVEVFTDPEGRFVVKIEGHEIPAVAHNKTILFTTGDVVHSRLPALGARPHATLEYLIVTRVGGQYYLAAHDARTTAGATKLHPAAAETMPAK